MMTFFYRLHNNQLYLAPSSAAADFTFLGIGFSKNQSTDLVPLSVFLESLSEETALLLLKIEASRYPNSKYYWQLKEINPAFVYQSEAEMIFFGGSFNPWHQGHRACLELLGKRKCIILPDRNPFKEVIKISPLRVYQDIFQHLDPNYHYLNPEFVLAEERNPTYTWVKTTQQRFPGADLSLLMGMDSLLAIDTWFMAPKLLHLLRRIYVASRLEDSSEQDKIRKELSLYPNLELVFLGHHPFESLSSTELRKEK